jgi:tetratricopeptide (TPR) repeat protein
MSVRSLFPLYLVATLAAPALAADELILVPNSTVDAPGGRIRGTIQSESPVGVKIASPTGTQEVPADQIESITYEGQPAAFQLARAREASGDLAAAIEQYKKAAAEGAGKPLIVQAAQFGQVRALGELALDTPARVDEAISQLESFLKSNPKTRHQGPALELLAKLELQKGDPDRADKAVNELAAISWAADRAAVLKARVLVKKGKPDDAISGLDKIISAAPKGSPKSVEARLAKGETLAAMKKFTEAEAAVREVIKETPPEKAEIQALAYNTLGDCLRAAGQPKSALLAYLQTVIVYDKDKEQLPRALYQASQVFRELKRDDRADELIEELKQKFPQSPYLGARAAK